MGFITEHTKGYLHVDERLNTLDSVSKAADFLDGVDQDLGNWKWFIKALHHGTYCLMILALENSDQSGIRIRDDRDKQGFILTVNPKNNKPVPLISFPEAYKRIQQANRMRRYVGSEPFAAKPEHDKAMKRLNEGLRNEFMHFEPKGWGIEINYVVRGCLPVLDVLRFLADTPQIIWDEGQRDKLKAYINRISPKLLSELRE